MTVIFEMAIKFINEKCLFEIVAEKSSRQRSNPPPVYDDATIENMVRYYGLKDEESLFKFIKDRGLHSQDQ